MLKINSKWINTVKCPQCNSLIEKNNIKEIGIYNYTSTPTHVYKIGNKSGNVFISILCNNCSFFGPLMLNTQFETIDEFIDFLLNCKTVNDYEQLVLFGV